MFTSLDLDLAHGRREELARQVNAARPEARPERVRRGGGWPHRLVHALRAPSRAAAPRGG